MAERGFEGIGYVSVGRQVGLEDVLKLGVRDWHTLVGNDELGVEVHHEQPHAGHSLRPLHRR